jgi:ZIP family zinc transporter
MTILFGILAFIFTFLGGFFAIKFKDKLHLILGFSAGAVLGVALFDLLPESIELAKSSYSVNSITALIAVGFIIFMILDRALVIHAHDDDNCENVNHQGFHGALTLCIHSFIDGFAIGLAFKISQVVGITVAIAVLVHDFSDGINTVNYIFKNQGKTKSAYLWLIVDALAPLLGVISTYYIAVSQNTLGLILAVFCGFFLYIGASDLVPESHHKHPKLLTTIMTILGMIVLYVVIKFSA